MLYVSQINHSIDKIMYGITDTDDNVTEFYSKEEIKNILPKIGFTSIKGVVYTGSDLKFRITSPAIEYIDSLQNGSLFTLSFSKEIRKYKKLNTLGAANGWLVEENGVRYKLLKQKLLSEKAIIVGIV